MRARLNFRLLVLLAALLVFAAFKISKEKRPSLLNPGLKMYAYVANAGDGTISAVDLIALRTVAAIPVGGGPSGLRTHPTRDEIWGVSTEGGYVWVINAHSSELVAGIEVGAAPYAVEFSPDGRTAYVAASGPSPAAGGLRTSSGMVTAIDCADRRVVGQAYVGGRPWLVRATPDGKMLVVPRRDDSTVTLLDAASLATLATIPVAPRPEQVVILPDSSKAFVSASADGAPGACDGSACGGRVSVVDLRRRVLLANVPLAGEASDLVLKPDGGELYVPSPGSNSLTILNTRTNEVASHLVVGSAPSHGVLSADDQDPVLYLSDAEANHVTPIQVSYRKTGRPIAAGRHPGVCRLTPGEDLLLVANEESNNLAVIRVRRGAEVSSLITLVPVGRRPQDLVVKVF